MSRMKYIPHSDMCGCNRCARQWETENPQQVFDEVPMTSEEEERARSDDAQWEGEYGHWDDD